MNDTDKRCGTCKHFSRLGYEVFEKKFGYVRGDCSYPTKWPSPMPLWLLESDRVSRSHNIAGDFGVDCNTWEPVDGTTDQPS